MFQLRKTVEDRAMFKIFVASLGTAVLLATAMPTMAAEMASAEMKDPQEGRAWER
jgi:hypothetical protein